MELLKIDSDAPADLRASEGSFRAVCSSPNRSFVATPLMTTEPRPPAGDR